MSVKREILFHSVNYSFNWIKESVKWISFVDNILSSVRICLSNYKLNSILRLKNWIWSRHENIFFIWSLQIQWRTEWKNMLFILFFNWSTWILFFNINLNAKLYFSCKDFIRNKYNWPRFSSIKDTLVPKTEKSIICFHGPGMLTLMVNIEMFCI